MSLMQFTLKNLDELDGGKAVKALAHHIKRAAEDCDDRPADGKARKVTLEFSFVPVFDDSDGTCAEVKATIVAKCSLPPQKTRPYSFGLRAGGMLVFNADAPDNVNQTTLIGDDV